MLVFRPLAFWGGVAGRTMPSFSAAGTGADAANDGIDVVMTVPGTINELLLMIFLIRINGTWDNKATVNSAGWNDLYVAETPSSNNLRAWMLWKLHDGSEPNVTCTYTGAAMAAGIIHSFANVDTSDPIDDIATAIHATGTPGSIGMPTVDTSFDNGLAVAVVMQTDDAVIASATGESGGDWVEVNEYNTSTGIDTTIQFQTANMPTAGTISGGSTAFATNAAVALGISLNGAP